jgi:DNA polymerase-3 subunit gamma/tau
MSKALYRKYRSKSLDEVVGQKHVTDILSRALKQGRIAHAYLLTGPKGVGKTSIARILAHEINKLPYTDDATHLDIIEIDAASNNGVEDIRDLRDKVQVAPVSAMKKVYIIDEVHMLSKAAFNALLKTLEEPPEHVVFILATTDADKLPATIISRTQRFGFRAITTHDAVSHLKTIAKSEHINIDDEALELIAEHGEGSFRDSISLLDQLASLVDSKEIITSKLIESALGLAPHDLVDKLLASAETHDSAEIIRLLDAAEQNGIQGTVLANQLITTLRKRIAETPQLVPLLDSLLEVNKSHHQSIKLLTTLVSFATPKTHPKQAALHVPSPSISATIPELERQAAKPIPQAVQPKPIAAPTRPKRAAAATSHTAQPTEEYVPQTSGSDYSLDWAALIEHTRQNYVAINSVLKKCTPEVDGTKLILYTGSNFYKKKLDDSRYRLMIIKSLEQTGAGDLTIETIPTPPPPKDSTAAAVAAIMGGGEEVTVSE